MELFKQAIAIYCWLWVFIFIGGVIREFRINKRQPSKIAEEIWKLFLGFMMILFMHAPLAALLWYTAEAFFN